MLTRHLSKSRELLKISKSSSTALFSMSTISEWMRKFMNRIKFEDNRAIQAKEEKVTVEIYQTPQEVDEKFIGNEQFKSLVEKERMQKIDEIIGTRTYFHQTKPYQERIDSDHVMVIDELAKKHPEPKRKEMNWENPQAPQQFKVKSTRKLYKKMKNLREYPKHNYRIEDFSDEKSEENIEFMGKESLYSKLSLKWVDSCQKSLETETVNDTSFELQSHRHSPLHVYFSAPHTPSKIHRIRHQQYTTELLNSVSKFIELQGQIQEVVSLEEIYDVLKEYFHDERVNEWLRKVENGQIAYMVSGYEVNRDQDRLVVWVDLLGSKKEYVHLYKNLKTKQIKHQLNQSPSDIPQSTTQQQQNTHQSQISQSESPQSSAKQPNSLQASHFHPLTPRKSSILFNCKPAIGFSHSPSIFMIQRSEQGTYIELIKVPIEDATDSFANSELIFRCKPYEEMEIIKDESLGYIFVKVREVGGGGYERAMIVEENDEGKVELVKVDLNVVNQRAGDKQGQTQAQKTVAQEDQEKQQVKQPQKPLACRLLLSSCSQGLLITEFHPTSDEYFKFGPSNQYARIVTLVPYKSHIQLSQTSSVKLERQFQIGGSVRTQRGRPSAKELDFKNRQVMYQCPPDEFITEVSVRQTHLVLSLSTISIYSKKRLHFLPYEQSKNPHSLIFNAHHLAFAHFGYCHSSQTVRFLINRSLVFNEYYQYVIWKKQLKELTDDDVYIEKIKLNETLDMTVTVMNRYLELLPKWFVQKSQEDLSDMSDSGNRKLYKMENSQVPVLVYLIDGKTASSKQPSSQSQTKSEVQFKKLLQKGTLVLTLSCRGTLYSDFITFSKGSGENFPQMLEDLEQAMEWIGNNLGTNISLYSKGPISGLAGMLLNVKYPFMLTATVLQDGAYQLLDKRLMYEDLDYFVRYGNTKRGSEKFSNFWRRFNPASFSFKKSYMTTKKMIQEEMRQNELMDEKKKTQQQAQLEEDKQKKLEGINLPRVAQIGTLQNLLICCSESGLSKNQARRMVYRLRKNMNFKYEQVYLKEFLEDEDAELFNLAYIWGKMRERLEEQHQK